MSVKNFLYFEFQCLSKVSIELAYLTFYKNLFRNSCLETNFNKVCYLVPLTDSNIMVITEDGLLKTAQVFDHEEDNKIDLFVQACDHGSPPRFVLALFFLINY